MYSACRWRFSTRRQHQATGCAKQQARAVPAETPLSSMASGGPSANEAATSAWATSGCVSWRPKPVEQEARLNAESGNIHRARQIGVRRL